MDARKNFAFGTLAAGINSAATSLSVGTGEGARFPAAPFNAVIWNRTDYASPAHAYHAGAAEIVRVTAIATDTLTITRAQESTSAVNHNTGGKTYEIWAGPSALYWTQAYAPGEILTTRGDLVRMGASTPERVALGSFGTRLMSDGSDAAWYAGNSFAHHWDDFIGSASGNALGWTMTANSGSIGVTNSEAGHPGVWSVTTGSNSGAAPVARLEPAGLVIGSGKIRITWVFRTPGISDGTDTYKLKIGAHDATSLADPTDGIYFTYTHSENSGKWVGVSMAAGVATTVNLATTVVGSTWYNLTLEIAANGGSVEFFVNGTSEGTISSGLPSSSDIICPGAAQIVKSVGTGARALLIDYYEFFQKLTTPR